MNLQDIYRQHERTRVYFIKTTHLRSRNRIGREINNRLFLMFLVIAVFGVLSFYIGLHNQYNR